MAPSIAMLSRCFLQHLFVCSLFVCPNSQTRQPIQRAKSIYIFPSSPSIPYSLHSHYNQHVNLVANMLIFSTLITHHPSFPTDFISFQLLSVKPLQVVLLHAELSICNSAIAFCQCNSRQIPRQISSRSFSFSLSFYLLLSLPLSVYKVSGVHWLLIKRCYTFNLIHLNFSLYFTLK